MTRTGFVAALILGFSCLACGATRVSDSGAAGSGGSSDKLPDGSGGKQSGIGGDAPEPGAGSGSGGASGGSGAVSGSGGARPLDLEPSHRLEARQQLLLPMADPLGITFDGTYFWMIFGEYGGSTYTLVQWDVENLEVLQTHVLENLFATSDGASAGGIAWGAGSIWISIAGSTNQLLEVDPTDGTTIRSLSSPSELGPTDLDYFEERLWVSTGTGSVYEIDPAKQSIEQSFPVFIALRDQGVAVREGEVWVAGLFGGIEVYDSSGAVLGRADGPNDHMDSYGTLCFAGDELVGLDEKGISFYTIEALR